MKNGVNIPKLHRIPSAASLSNPVVDLTGRSVRTSNNVLQPDNRLFIQTKTST